MFPLIVPDSNDGARIKDTHLHFCFLFQFSFFSVCCVFRSKDFSRPGRKEELMI